MEFVPACNTVAFRVQSRLAHIGSDRRTDAGCVRRPGLDGVRDTRGTASALWHLLLPGCWALLRNLGEFTPTGHRADVSHFPARWCDRCRYGGRRSFSLGRRGVADGTGRRWTERASLVAAIERPRQLHQWNNPARIQGRSGAHDCDDAVAETVRCAGGATRTSCSAPGYWADNSATRT